MNDNAIKNYAVWARRELIADVQKRCMRYGISETGSTPADADSIEGRVLTALERQQRKTLLALAKNIGYRELVERAAYTWFNRLLAIRFMEVNDRLPSHVRVLSAGDGSFKPQALAEAMDLPLDALDPTEVANLIQRGDDEALFRTIFLAQCDELASCMPDVFDKVGSAMELLLPDGLLREDGVVERLVTSIPEDDWREGVEIVGWMYQYYVSERKDEVFASFKKGKKAERESIAPATQLFTPNWIVRYLTENSLGRLWMLNRPESGLVDDMPYFVKPDEDAETEFKRVASPEEITVVDPACGSGHILVYAFELLSKMYVEAGYTSRDAARLILEKNLSGMEIDPRAGAMASFALTMKACELDSRFLRRGVTPRITVLNRVEFDSEELRYIKNLRNRSELMDAVAHLDECGSLLNVTSEDLEAIARDLATLAGEGSIFGGLAARKLEQLQAELEPLSRRYDVVVANPPYMGSNNMNGWLANWTRRSYPDAKRDLCTCFIERGFTLAKECGYEALITSDTCMYISSFEQLRRNILSYTTIIAFIDTRGTNAHPDVFDANAGWVLHNKKADQMFGSYFKLSHPIAEKEERFLEALANPDCGWFYRRNSKAFEVIPGSPFGYWVNESLWTSYEDSATFADMGHPKVGMQTSNNEKYLRLWWEVGYLDFAMEHNPPIWIKYLKGGDYRKWYGNLEYLLHYRRDPNYILQQPNAKVLGLDYLEKTKCTWTDLTSGEPSFRYAPKDTFYDISGHCFFPPPEDQFFLLAYANSSLVASLKKVFNSSFHFQCGDLAKIIVPKLDGNSKARVSSLAKEAVSLAKSDWDSIETSWDFVRHPLV